MTGEPPTGLTADSAHEEETMSDEKPRTDKTPNTTPAEFSARLQVLTLPGDDFALIFDQWDGRPLPQDNIKSIKDATGARGVLVFRGTIDIDC